VKRAAKVFVVSFALATFGIAAIAMQDLRCRFDPAELSLHTLQMRIQGYQLDTGELPETLDALLANDGRPGWNGPYARPADLLDPWHRPICYETFRTARLDVTPPDGTRRRSLEF
jgi:general secretion pathway protein G